MTPAYNENLERAIGAMLSDHMKKAERSFELIEAKFGSILADLRARAAEDEARIVKFVDGLKSTAEERLNAAVSAIEALPVPKDGTSVTVDDVTPLIERMIGDQFDRMNQRSLAAIDEAVAALPAAKDGTSVTVDDVAPMLQSLVEERVAVVEADALAKVRAAVEAIPTPKDGVSVTVDDVTPLLERAIAGRISELTERTVQDFQSAKIDLDLHVGKIEEEVRQIAEASAAQVISRFEAIPVPKDGTSVTVEDVAPLIEDLVGKATAPLSEAIRGELDAAIKAIPVPKDGTSVTAEDVSPMVERLVGERIEAAGIAEAVKDAVDAIPRPKDGLDGRIDRATPWEPGVHYARQIRTHAGGTWQALQDTATEPPHADWQCLAAPGAQGASFEVQGAYDDKEDYRALNVVQLNGSSFVATKDNPGACPGAGWRLLASAGGRGKQGDAGKRGEPGKNGKDGVEVAAFHMDGASIVLTLSDGTSHSVDLGPLLESLIQ